MYEDILRKMMDEIRYNEWNCDDKDVERSYCTMGCIEGYVDVLNMMGYDAECGGYDDDNYCYRFAYLEINGVVFVKNGDFQKAYFEALA